MGKIEILSGLGNLSIARTSTNIVKAIDYPQGGLVTNLANNTGYVAVDITSTSKDSIEKTREEIRSELIEPSTRSELFKDYPIIESTSNIVESKTSITAPFYSLFNNFKFIAIPHFNFFTEDEETNFREGRGDKKLTDIPRYIQLKWNTAPITERSPIESAPPPPSNKRTKNSSFKKGKTIQPSSARGLTFEKDTNNTFSNAIRSLSNGFISPGVIHSIIELPLDKAGFKTPVHTPKVDEQLFLTSELTNGLSIHDVQANINIRTNGIIGAGKISTDIISNDTKTIKSELFDRKFAIAHVIPTRRGTGIKAQSSVLIRGVADKSSLTMRLSTAAESSLNSGASQGIDIIDDLMEEVLSDSIIKNNESDFTEVNFVDPAIVGLVSSEKIELINAPEHAENTSGLAQYLPNFKMMSELNPEIKRTNNLPVFSAFEDEAGTEYIGYIIEKYLQGNDGVFDLIETIEISDVLINEYIDTKVSYGSVYRYRIKSILSWVRSEKSNNDSFTNKNSSQTKSLASFKKSFFNTEWSRKWQYATVLDTVQPFPPDEFLIRSQSFKKRNIISWKVPENNQRDIYYFKLFRKIQTIEGNDLSGWEVISIQFGAVNGLFIDNDVEFFQDEEVIYVYAAQTISKHGEFSKLSQQIGVRLNKQFKFSGEFNRLNISEEGVDLFNVGVFTTKPVKKFVKEIIIKNRLLMTTRQGLHKDPFLDTSYCIRIESLDTGKTIDITFDTIFDNGIDPEIIDLGHSISTNHDSPIEDDWRYRNMFDDPITIDERGNGSDSDS